LEQIFVLLEVLIHHIIVWFQWIDIYLFKKPSNGPFTLSTFGHFLSYLKVRVGIAMEVGLPLKKEFNKRFYIQPMWEEVIWINIYYESYEYDIL